MKVIRGMQGASLIELMVQAFIIMTIAPVIVCCLLQAVTMITAIVVPWVVVGVLVIGIAVCVAAAVAAGARLRGHLPPPPAGGPDGEPILPIRRPPPLPAPGQGRER